MFAQIGSRGPSAGDESKHGTDRCGRKPESRQILLTAESEAARRPVDHPPARPQRTRLALRCICRPHRGSAADTPNKNQLD